MESKEQILKRLDSIRWIIDTRVHPVLGADNWDIYSELCDLVDLTKEAVLKPDCEHAEHDGRGCLGYCGCSEDDEPIDVCKSCERYTGNLE